jgi:hypothetical protein
MAILQTWDSEEKHERKVGWCWPGFGSRISNVQSLQISEKFVRFVIHEAV